MKTRHNVLATALAAAALAAGGAWAQAGSTGATSQAAGGPGMASPAAGNSALGGSLGATTAADRTNSRNTHLSADCFDRTTGVRRTAPDCVSIAGPVNSPGTPGIGADAAISGPASGASSTLNSSQSLGTSNSSGAAGSINSSGTVGSAGTSGSLNRSDTAGSTGGSTAR